MKLKYKTLVEAMSQISRTDLSEVLIRHLEYSMKDVKSYDELTSEEKSIIPKEIFNHYFEEGKNGSK